MGPIGVPQQLLSGRTYSLGGILQLGCRDGAGSLSMGTAVRLDETYHTRSGLSLVTSMSAAQMLWTFHRVTTQACPFNVSTEGSG